MPRLLPRVPGAIVALLVGTAASMLMPGVVETVGSRFGGIPSGLPTFAMPQFRADLILPLLPAALTVALLSAVESLLSATVADRMTGDVHNPHAELLAQGVANLVVPMVGGIPVTGAIARTATNVRAGAVSPVSGLVHAGDAAGGGARGRAAGQAHPDGDARRRPVRGGVEHGRVVRDSRASSGSGRRTAWCGS